MKVDDNDPELTPYGQVMRDIRAISLDLDDTLWPIVPVIKNAERALTAWLRTHLPHVATHYTAEVIERVRDDIVRERPDMHHDLTFIRCEVLARIGRLGGQGREFVADAFAVFDHARHQVELYPDALSALETLAERFPLIALTNGNARLDQIGLDHHFHAIITARDAGIAKPDPTIFHAAARAADLAPAQVLHVGDHPEHDVSGANEAGMKSVWLNRRDEVWPQSLTPPDIEITSLDQLLTLLPKARA